MLSHPTRFKNKPSNGGSNNADGWPIATTFWDKIPFFISRILLEDIHFPSFTWKHIRLRIDTGSSLHLKRGNGISWRCFHVPWRMRRIVDKAYMKCTKMIQKCHIDINGSTIFHDIRWIETLLDQRKPWAVGKLRHHSHASCEGGQRCPGPGETSLCEGTWRCFQNGFCRPQQ